IRTAKTFHRSAPGARPMKPTHSKNKLDKPMALAAVIAAVCLPAAGAAVAQTIEETVKVAPGLYQIVYSPSSNALYVASTGERGADNAQIVVLDGDTLEREGSIPLSMPLYGLGLNDRTGTLYGTDTPSGNVAAVDIESGRIVATIGESNRAHHVR